MTFGAPNKEQSWDKSQTEALYWEFWNRNTPYLGWRASQTATEKGKPVSWR